MVIKSESDLLKALGVTKEGLGEGLQLADIKRLVATQDGSDEKKKKAEADRLAKEKAEAERLAKIEAELREVITHQAWYHL